MNGLQITEAVEIDLLISFKCSRRLHDNPGFKKGALVVVKPNMKAKSADETVKSAGSSWLSEPIKVRATLDKKLYDAYVSGEEVLHENNLTFPLSEARKLLAR